VRCQRCGESWFAKGEAVTPDDLALQDLEAPEAHVMELPEPETEVKAAPPKSEIKARVKASGLPNAATLMRERQYMKRRSDRMKGIAAIWAAAAALLVTGLMLVFALRQPLVERFPGLANFYGAVGIKVHPSGFALSPVEARHVRLDGQDYLVVSGEVMNLTGEGRAAPLVEMRLLSAGGEELARWSVDPGGSLSARGRKAYESEYPNPPLDAVRLVYGLEE